MSAYKEAFQWKDVFSKNSSRYIRLSEMCFNALSSCLGASKWSLIVISNKISMYSNKSCNYFSFEFSCLSRNSLLSLFILFLVFDHGVSKSALFETRHFTLGNTTLLKGRLHASTFVVCWRKCLLEIKFKFKFQVYFQKITDKFYNEHYTRIAMPIEACSVIAYMALNLLETILRQNKTSQYTLSHHTVDRLKKRCIIITILLK